MPEFVTPDDLDELDRRVYDFAIQPIPLAEIAVRLGVPVPQADEKLQRLFRRLGVEDRAELRALAEGPSPALPMETEAAPEFVIGEGTATDDDPVEPTPRRISRRALIGAAAGVAVSAFVGGSALGWRSRRQGDSVSGPFGPESGMPAIGPSRAFPLAPLDPSSLWTAEWKSGEPIDWTHGIFANAPETGIITGYQFAPYGSEASWLNYRMLARGRVVAGEQPPPGAGVLFDRRYPERVWSWPIERYALRVAFARGQQDQALSLLFEDVNATAVERTLHFVRLEPTGATTISTVKVSGAGAQTELLLSPDSSLVAIFDGGYQIPSVRVMDISVGLGLNEPAVIQQGDPKGPGITARSLRPCEDGFIAAWQTATNGRGEIPVQYFSRRFAWDGSPQGPVREHAFGVEFAPNGEAVLTERSQGTQLPEGTPVGWPSVEYARQPEARPQFRLRSSSILFGDQLTGTRWLSDGSGFVAAVRGESPFANGYTIVPVSGDPIVPLPRPPNDNSGRWYDQPWICAPLPCPDNPNLFSFGRLYAYNRANDRWTYPLLTQANGPAHLDPWSGSPMEMVFALGDPGHGLPGPPLLLAPKFETSTFDSPELLVEVDPEGLNLRAGPELSAEVLALLHDGERVTLVAAPEDGSIAPSDYNTRRTEDALWLRVRTPAGLEGWVNSTWIAWA